MWQLSFSRRIFVLWCTNLPISTAKGPLWSPRTATYLLPHYNARFSGTGKWHRSRMNTTASVFSLLCLCVPPPAGWCSGQRRGSWRRWWRCSWRSRSRTSPGWSPRASCRWCCCRPAAQTRAGSGAAHQGSWGWNSSFHTVLVPALQRDRGHWGSAFPAHARAEPVLLLVWCAGTEHGWGREKITVSWRKARGGQGGLRCNAFVWGNTWNPRQKAIWPNKRQAWKTICPDLPKNAERCSGRSSVILARISRPGGRTEKALDKGAGCGASLSFSLGLFFFF